MDPIKGRDPLTQKLMEQRANAVIKQREQILQKNEATVTKNPDGSMSIKANGHTASPVHLKDESSLSKNVSQAAATNEFRAKTGALVDKILNESVNKPFEEGLISEQTRDDLLKAVADGTMSRKAATYLATQVDALGGDVMVNIALDLCKQDPAKFKNDFDDGNLYETLVEEHHNRYYPNPEEDSVEATPVELTPDLDIKQPEQRKEANQAAPTVEIKKPAPAQDGIHAVIRKPLDDGIISEQTRDDLLKMVSDGSLSQKAATYLAENVDALGGDVMVNIALDLCKQDPAKFNKDVQAGSLYQSLADEHHNRYYPAE